MPTSMSTAGLRVSPSLQPSPSPTVSYTRTCNSLSRSYLDTLTWRHDIPRRKPSSHTPSVSHSRVSNFAPDSPKFPYIDVIGVLGALSELQKEHRKHAVHMATLRAHGTSERCRSSRGLAANHRVAQSVRLLMRAKISWVLSGHSGYLGQSRNWCVRAISWYGLPLTSAKADDGILDNSDPHGNVTFTPDAKKTFVRTILGCHSVLTRF